jgi:hypothetical protein
MSKDAHHGLETMDELRAVLDDLKTDGYASTSKDGWKMTQKGFEALTVSPAEAPSNNVPSRPALLRGLES